MATFGINRVIVLGRVGKYGVTVRQQGAHCASFVLNIPECARDGQIYTTRVPIEIWGTHAQEATRLAAGQWVLVEGKLRKRQRPDDAWELIVSAFEAVPVGPASPGSHPQQPSLL